jgi:release factor glutamine methyltransferase
VLLITVLCEIANAWGVGVDRSESAIAIARDNAARHGVYDRAHFLVGDWAAPLAARFDLIVANPPYLTTAELACAAPELAAEPAGALDGGEDGLNAYRAILLKLEALMAPGALAVLEIGAGQGAVLGALAGARGLESGAAGRDLAGHERVLTMSRGGAA